MSATLDMVLGTAGAASNRKQLSGSWGVSLLGGERIGKGGMMPNNKQGEQSVSVDR